MNFRNSKKSYQNIKFIVKIIIFILKNINIQYLVEMKLYSLYIYLIK